jgi:tryptophanyl-tRNA synthetase
MSLRDGTKKMSKSEPSDMSRINLTDDADTIARRSSKAKTDPRAAAHERRRLETRPRPTTSSASTRRSRRRSKSAVLAEFGRRPVLQLQEALSELAVSRIGPVNAEMSRLLADPARSTASSPRVRARPRPSPPHRGPRQGYRRLPAVLSRLRHRADRR